MSLKKFAVLGILACVVIGCVLAAGCTSQVNTNSNQVNPLSGSTVETPDTSDDPIVGTWVHHSSSQSITFSSDHTCNLYALNKETPELRKSFTWEKISDGRYTVKDTESDGSFRVTLNSETGTIALSNNILFEKQES